MKRAFGTSSTLLLVAALTMGGCSSGRGSDAAATQEQFGVRMARMNLWREALFRFKRAVQIDPADAMAHNNLAVAYEANGDFENALKEYREAIRLDKSNQYIQKNYSRFVEFTSRNRKRQQQNATARTAAAAAAKAAASEPGNAPAEPAAAPPAPSEPVSAVPVTSEGGGAAGVPGSVSSPMPTGAAPASTPPPNPKPEPAQPTPSPDPPKPEGVLA